MKLNLPEIIKASGAEVLRGCMDSMSGLKCAKIGGSSENAPVFGFSSDTRTIQKGEIYIPLKGENFDGENFIEAALKSGAAGYFTSCKNKIFENASVILYVPDTKEACLKLARFYKRKINPFTITVTGSSGKTTVKEMLYSVFKNAGNTVKSVLNHNNEIGLYQTLSSLENNTKYLIVEAGMRGLGEIELISKYSEPDTGIITNAGTAHIGRLGSKLNIAKAKFEIASHLKDNGILIAHDNELIKQINDNKHKTIYFSLKDARIKEMTADFSVFIYKNNEYRINVPGEYNIQNALAVIEAGLAAGLSCEIIKQGLEEFSPMDNRGAMQKINGFNIINDCYNANPESVKASIKNFSELTPEPKCAVLGDMGELGAESEKYHKEIGQFLEQYNFSYLLTLGELAKNINPVNIKTVHFDNKKEIADFIMHELPAGANILFKASRFMKFEEIIEELKNSAV